MKDTRNARKIIYEATFETIEQAQEASNSLNSGIRNRGFTVAFRDGCKVWIRPEYASPQLGHELYDLTRAF